MKDDKGLSLSERIGWFLSDVSPWRTAERLRVMSLLDLSAGDVLLDAGCGTGFFTRKAGKHIRMACGVDRRSFCEWGNAENPKNEKFFEMNLSGMSFRNSYFDKIVSLHVLEHIPPGKLEKTISEFGRVLKRGGKLVVAVPAERVKGDTLLMNPFRGFEHVNRFTASSMASLLGKGGFEVRGVFYNTFLPFLQLGKTENQLIDGLAYSLSISMIVEARKL